MTQEILSITEPPSKEELAQRLEKVRRLMEASGLDCYVSAHTDNVYYLIHFAYFPLERPFFLVIRKTGPLVMVLPLLEVDHARQRVISQMEYVTYSEYPAPKGQDYATALRQVINDGETAGIESSLPLVHHGVMPGQLQVADIIDEARLVKSDYEMGRIAYACQVVDSGIAKVLELSRPGAQQLSIYSEGVRQMMGHVLLTVPNANLLVSKFVAAVWPKTLSAQPHAIPGIFDTLEAGGPQVTIVTAQADGYSAEVERTFFIGEMPEACKAPYEVMMEARALAYTLIKPGVSASEVDAAVLALIREKGYGEGILHRTGHGFGITGHEPPWIAVGSSDVLEKNMVVSVEPGIYLRQIGGFRHSDTVRVTDDGCQPMTAASDRLEELILPGA